MDLRLRSDLLGAGYTDAEIRRELRRGTLRRLRPGAYLTGAAAEDDRAARHLALVRATVAGLSPNAVVSHVSAAVTHGLPIWAVPLDRVHVTRDRRSGVRRAPRIHAHAASLDAEEIVLRTGLAVTSLARTVVDVARQVPFEQAVVVADAALATGDVDPAGLADALGRAARWPGLPAARRAVAFADGRSQSVGESRSRVAIARAGLPAPELQWQVRAADDGRLIGEVDFYWAAHRTIGEFDGKVKYGRLLRPGQAAGDVVYREKLREDDLRAEDHQVIRWGWADLDDFTCTATRLHRYLHRS